VIIIHQGKLVADDLTSHLSTSQSKDIITVEFGNIVKEKLLRSIPGVTAVTRVNDTTWRLQSTPGQDIRPQINRMAVENNLILLGLHREEQRLEEVFQQLTRQ
jgi:ABC-type multidrug transport system ATPase subunit